VVREHLEAAVVGVLAGILNRVGAPSCDGRATDLAATLQPCWDMELLTAMTTWIGGWRQAHPALWRWLARPLRSGCDWHSHMVAVTIALTESVGP
jgi:hypothetical protein